jgi:hypothetical protein
MTEEEEELVFLTGLIKDLNPAAREAVMELAEHIERALSKIDEPLGRLALRCVVVKVMINRAKEEAKWEEGMP